ncbi:MAG TPA: TIGR02996 domain-containing protein, partial [Gemmata sp.]
RPAAEMRLIRAALANPEEEQPYLDYADWLDGRGDPYAEFLRLSLQMEPLAEGDKFRKRFEDRLHDLGEKHGAKWLRGLTELGLFPGMDPDNDPSLYEYSFDPLFWFGAKGVIDQLAIRDGTFVFHTDPARLFAAAPFLRELTVFYPGVSVAELAAIPQAAQLDALYLTGVNGTDDDFQRFADTGHFAGLKSLGLTYCGISPEQAQILGRARWLPQLTGLCLNLDAVGDHSAALTAVPGCANLEWVRLDNIDLTDAGLTALCRSPHLTKLSNIDLEGNAFTAAGTRALAAAAFAPALCDLNIRNCRLDGPAIRALAECAFPELRMLNVSEHAGDDDAMRALIGSPFFRGVMSFGACNSALGAGTVDALVGAGSLSLVHLALAGNRLGPRAVAALVRSKVASKLKSLSLSRNPIGTDGVRALTETDLPALESLDLGHIRLDREAVQALARAPWRKQLQTLVVSRECVSERGQELLTDRFGKEVLDVIDGDEGDE